MHRRFRALLLGAFLLFVAPATAFAQADPLRENLGSTDFDLTADEVRYDRNTDVYEASGNVRVEQSDGRTLATDWLVFNGTTRVGVASGHVRMVDATDTVEADFIAVDLRSMVAMATRASLDTPTPGFVVRGDALQRSGPNSYSLEKGMFTTCRCPGDAKPRPWELEVEDAKIDIGGYAVGKHLKFRVLDVPVFYLPFIAFPAKTERQTGLLLPSFSASGRGGAEVELPFFMTLGEQVNLILRPTWFAKRGVKGAAEIEYVFGSESAGAAGLAVLPGDDEVSPDDFETPFSDNRWAYWWQHSQPLTDRARFGLDLKGVSDNQYVVDFDDLPRELRNSRFLESTAWASHADWGLYAGVETAMIDDLQSPSDLDRDDFLLQRLPDVRLSRLPRPIAGSPLRFGFDSRYTYFHQWDGRSSKSGHTPLNGQFFDTGRDGLFDGEEPDGNGFLDPLADHHNDNAASLGRDRSEGDGFYQEGELLADRGHRLDIYPHLSLPQRLGVFETLSELGYRETLYFPDVGETERREMWTGRFDVRTRFAKSMTFRSLPMRHIVEPRVTLVAVSTPSQNRNPLFLPALSSGARRLIDGDARLLTRNPTDRVEDERILQYQIGNRFYGPSFDGGRVPQLLGEIRVGAGYDFDRSENTRVFADGLVRPWKDFEFRGEAGWDPETTRVDEAFASARWDSARGHLLGLSYRYLRDRVLTFENFVRQNAIYDEYDDGTKVSQIGLDSVLVVSRRLEIFASGFVALNQSSSSAGRIGFQLGSDCRCWDLLAQIEHRTRPSETRFSLELRLAGFGQRSRVRRRKERERR
ncbi:MAG: LPS-assembly protein LptD [bacterium]|nr:LPS-assembly protein LptD [bacterium]